MQIRGLVTATVSYRQPLPTGWEPDGTLEDAKSAMRWMRSHARELGVDADKIIAAGGSWGGMLAANLALISGFDASGDDLSISCEPCALVLWNPAVGVVKERKNAKGELVGEKMAPILLVKKNAPPAIVFCGTGDPRIKDGAEFVAKFRALGNRCDYFTAAEQGHGSFNTEPWTTATAREVERFLISLGHLSEHRKNSSTTTASQTVLFGLRARGEALSVKDASPSSWRSQNDGDRSRTIIADNTRPVPFAG